MGCCICALFWIILAAVGWKIYLKLRTKKTDSYTCLNGKTAIVTGANTGIGYVTALDFACRGARVILGCRNKEKAEEACEKIKKETGNDNVVYKLLNMTSLQSVRDFAKDINENEDRLDILVNNAGAGGLGNHVTEDGLQITIQVNHLSGFLLTHLLIEKLKKSAPSRIVNVSSIGAKFAKINIDALNMFPQDVGPARADTRLYGVSKLCNIYFTTELAKKLDGSGVTVNALHPGAVLTDIFRRMPKLMKTIVMAFAKPYFKTPEEGARTSIHVATSRSVQHITGQLFDNCQQIELYDSAKDAEIAKKLWTKSEELVKLKREEKIK
ncbi:retinol dehydrogenase 14-like [Onthophagus taurus]|uniref:retinol dehydrogenase 14-like n=1 Tax=Onthophagus taurus TaxID=166361 RepID=UPI0039BDB49A